MNITGGCHCGAIRYEAEVDPASLRICHCTDCQIQSGSAFRPLIRALPSSFRIVTGAPRIYIKTAESGARREQAFCETCGSPIFAAPIGPEPRAYNLRAGTIDQRHQLRPADQLWQRSQLPWFSEINALPGFDKGPWPPWL
jgi:hypothetical protein